ARSLARVPQRRRAVDGGGARQARRSREIRCPELHFSEGPRVMAEPVAIGIIGCGNVSDLYLKGAGRSQLIRVKSVADLRPEAAEARAKRDAHRAFPFARLLAAREMEVVTNRTVPPAHAAVSRRIIDSGKHVYSEKPLATDVAAGRALIEAAAARRLRV